MEHRYSRNLVDILRGTLRLLERDADFRQDEPAVVHLKRSILQSLAELDAKRSSEPDFQPEKPLMVVRVR